MKRNIIMIVLFILNVALFAVEVLLPDNSIYYGNLKEGLFSGKAVQIWSNGDKYEGEYQNGLFQQLHILTKAIILMEYKPAKPLFCTVMDLLMRVK